MTDPYKLALPAHRDTSVVYSSPHSGRDYPWSFVKTAQLGERELRSSEDAFIDLLFSDAPRQGAPLLAATAPRAYLDPNRAADELDPALIEGVERRSHNPRIASGLGVVPRVVSNGRVIRSGKMSKLEAKRRIEKFWHPYHARLQSLLGESHKMFGEAILVDCHSMPHEALDNVARNGRIRPDIVLGDRFGASARSDILDRLEEVFSRSGLKVARNTPFAGAFITQHYGSPSRGQHAIQIEINRSLYMHEREIKPNRNFDTFRSLISRAIADINDIGRKDLRLAAE